MQRACHVSKMRVSRTSAEGRTIQRRTRLLFLKRTDKRSHISDTASSFPALTFSALTRIPVRHDLAMTGEITLRGRVLPIGGLKEKILAAHRGGIKKIIIPKDNEKDLRDIPATISKQLEIVSVEHMDEVLPHALVLAPGETLFSSHDMHFDIQTKTPDNHAPIN